jgi:hypothetical protein
MLRHIFVTTMPGADVDLRNVQIAARHTIPRDEVLRQSPQEPRSPPRAHPGHYMATARDSNRETPSIAEMRAF